MDRFDLITRREAARRSGLGLRQINAAVEAGELPLYRIGGWPRMRWEDVLAWLESHREQPQEPRCEPGQAGADVQA